MMTSRRTRRRVGESTRDDIPVTTLHLVIDQPMTFTRGVLVMCLTNQSFKMVVTMPTTLMAINILSQVMLDMHKRHLIQQRGAKSSCGIVLATTCTCQVNKSSWGSTRTE